MSTGGILFSGSIGMDYWLTLGGDEEGQGGLLFGLRAGYMFAPMKPDWKMGEIDLVGGPDARLTGPHVHIVFGGGGRAKRSTSP